jgi:hypothetical protein
MIKKNSGKLKEFSWVFLLLTILALYLVKLAFQQSPFNSFEDDAAWLLPSLARDMSTLSWSEQLARDVGERGALSLNMMLRFLYLVFDGWPTGYILFGIFVHTISTFLLFVVLRKSGYARVTSLVTTIFFLLCSLQFHAIFWIIGVQHVLAVGSIFATCIVAQQIFRLAYCRYQKLTFWHYAITPILLLLLGFNRASIAINLFVWSLFFVYYGLKLGLGGVVDKRKRRAAIGRLYGFYVAGMLVIPAFSFYQFSHQGEGWQIINALQHSRIPASLIQYFSSIPHLYTGLIVALALFCALTLLMSTYLPFNIRKHFANICYFSGVIGIAATLIFLKKTRYVLPAILENLIFIPDDDVLDLRWSPIDVLRFASPETTNFVNIALCLALLAIFVFARPKKNLAKLLNTTLFFMVVVGLVYFNSLTSSPLSPLSPLSVNAIPSRYVYYFTPAVILGFIYVLTDILSLHRFASYGNYLAKLHPSGWRVASVLRLDGFRFLGKWDLIKGIILVFFVCSFLLTNARMLNKRLDHATVDTFYTWFGFHPSFVLAESIALWAKNHGHVGSISINLSGYPGVDWSGKQNIASFVPPADSVFDPGIFRTQAYLTQMIGREARLRTVSGPADIIFCDGEWYGRTTQSIADGKDQCDCGCGLQLLEPNLNEDSLLLRGALRDFPDLVLPRYEATLADGITFGKEGFPKFMASVSGLGVLEGFGRWTVGSITVFRFKQELPSKFKLLISFGASGPNVGKPTVIRIGNINKLLTVASPVGTEYSLDFEGVEHSNTIKIIPFSHVPLSDLDPKNPDKRSIGLALIYLKII